MQFLELTYLPQLQPNPSRISYVDGTLTLDSPFTVEYDVYERNMDTNTGWEFIGTTVFKTLDIGDAHMVRVVPEGWKIRYGVDLAFSTREVNDNNPYYDSARDKTPSTYLAKEDESSNWNSVLRGSTIPLTELLESSTQASLEHSGIPTQFFEPCFDNVVSPSEAEKAGTAYTLHGDGIQLEQLTNLDNVLPSSFELHEVKDWIPYVPSCTFNAPHLQFQTAWGSEHVKFYFNQGTNEVIGFLNNCGEVVYKIPIDISGTHVGFYYSPDTFYFLQIDGIYYVNLDHTVDEQTPVLLSNLSTSGHYLIVLPGGFATYDSGFKIYTAHYDYFILSENIHVLDDYNQIVARDEIDVIVETTHKLLWTSEDDRSQFLGLYRLERQNLVDFHVNSRLYLSSNPTHNLTDIERVLSDLDIDCSVINMSDLPTLAEQERGEVVNEMNAKINYSMLKVNNFSRLESGLEPSYGDLTSDSNDGIVSVLSSKPIPKVIFGSTNPLIVSNNLEIESFNDSTYTPSKHVSNAGVFLYGTKEFIQVPPGDETKFIKLDGSTLTATEDLSGLEIDYIVMGERQSRTLDFSASGAVYEATLPNFDYDLNIYADLYVITDEVLYSFDGTTINLSEPTSAVVVYDSSDEGYIPNITEFVFGLTECSLKPEATDLNASYSANAQVYVEDGYLYIDVNVEDNDTKVPARGTIGVNKDGTVWTIEPLMFEPFVLDYNPGGTYNITVNVTEVYPFAGEKEYVDLTTTVSDTIESVETTLSTNYLGLEFDAV